MSSGIDSCTVPLVAMGALVSWGASAAVPFGMSALGSRL